MSEFEYSICLMPLIQQLNHSEDCLCDALGDGLPCSCGLDDILAGFEKYSKWFCKQG